MSTYVIVGGHGKVARLTEPLLTARGDTVNAIIRDRAQVADVAACGAEPVVLDMQMAGVEEMAEVFRGADAVVWSAGAGGGSPERTYGVDRDAAMRSMDAAALAHVDRYVMVSYWGAGRDLDRLGPSDGFRPYAEAKAAADAHLRASSLAWTILGPTGLTMQDPSGLIDVGNPEEPYTALPPTSRGNVAAVVVAVLADDATAGRTISFHDGATPIERAIGADRDPVRF
ncbi:MAG: NAD(P)H-binding protein [Bifidobacterium mongoliense]|jgi:uncharacterized protein YbjT (DUF2867 family)|uniref:NAD(P)H-binding protein n=1 Tax=Bifidobacterium mongoliense TaxID=518643 RepID=UPI002F34F666